MVTGSIIVGFQQASQAGDSVQLVAPTNRASSGTYRLAPEAGRGTGTRQSRKFRSSYVADAGGSVSEAMHAVSRRRI